MPPTSDTAAASATSSAATAALEQAPITAAQIIRTARKHLGLFLTCCASVILLVLFWSLGQTKVYRAETLLRLDPEPPRPLGQKVELMSDPASTYWNHREFFESEYRVIKSMRVATAVVKALGLNADPGFVRKPAAGFKPISVEEAAQLLILRISVEPVKDSSLVMIRYDDTDPKRCQLVLNTLARTYLTQNLETTADISANALEWLNGQLDSLKTTLEKSEVALNDFRQKNNVLSISLEDRHNMIAEQLDQVAKETTSLEIRRIELAARYAELKKLGTEDPTKDGVTELLQSQVLNTLRTEYAQQQRNLDELTSTLGDEHPKVLAARAKLKAVSESIKSEIENIRTAVGRDLDAVSRQITELRKKDEDIQRQAHELQGYEITYNQLNRTKVNNEKIYGIVLERARETDLTRVMNFNNIRVVDEAIEPKIPVRPNIPANLAVGTVVGILIGFGAAALRELTDRSLRTPQDVEVGVGVTCLGLLPEISPKDRERHRKGNPKFASDRDLIVAHRPDGGVAEAARAIRTNLTFMSPDRPYKSILVTSAIPEEGKTTVALSLATVMAQGGHRVLLIDTDLRRPRLHRTFGVSNDLGVTMVVSGQASLEECIQETGIPNLSVLTSGPIPPNPAELLQSERFGALARNIAAKFDRVVFDSPPILPVTDAAIISRLVDGVAVVVRGFRTQKTAAKQAVRHLFDVKAHIIGVILNAIDLGRADYSEYHYYYKRDGYYSSRGTESATATTSRKKTHDHDVVPPTN